MGGRPVHCRAASSIPGLHPLDAGGTSPSGDNRKCIPTVPTVPWRETTPPREKKPRGHLRKRVFSHLCQDLTSSSPEWAFNFGRVTKEPQSANKHLWKSVPKEQSRKQTDTLPCPCKPKRHRAKPHPARGQNPGRRLLTSPPWFWERGFWGAASSAAELLPRGARLWGRCPP